MLNWDRNGRYKISHKQLTAETVRYEFGRELGHTKSERDLNIHRMAFVASELVKAGAIAICSAIAPFEEARQQARKLVEKYGGFFLIHVNTPLDYCERTDRKGVYARARNSEIRGFTGIDDPYEPPAIADLTVDVSQTSISQIVHEIILLLEKDGYFD
jgi:sulfate adenylyltransferase